MLSPRFRKRIVIGLAAAIWPVALAGCQSPAPADDPAAKKAAEDAQKLAAQIQNTPPTPGGAPLDVDPASGMRRKPAPPAPVVKPVAEKPAAPPPAPEQPAPPPAPPKKPAPLSTAQLVEQLAARLKNEPKNSVLRRHLAMAALTLADPSRELTAAQLTGLGDEDRKLVLAYQRTFTELARSMTGDAAADRQRLRSAAEELLEQINASRQIAITAARLCTKVSGYGVYSAFEKNSFLAGKDQPVIVYAELDHFGSETDDHGQNVVRLTQQIVLYNDADGLEVWKVKPTEIVDRSRNRRRDFFVVQIVTLPARLSVGKYRMKVTITDQITQSVDEASIPIQIVADGDLATAR